MQLQLGSFNCTYVEGWARENIPFSRVMNSRYWSYTLPILWMQSDLSVPAASSLRRSRDSDDEKFKWKLSYTTLESSNIILSLFIDVGWTNYMAGTSRIVCLSFSIVKYSIIPCFWRSFTWIRGDKMSRQNLSRMRTLYTSSSVVPWLATGWFKFSIRIIDSVQTNIQSDPCIAKWNELVQTDQKILHLTFVLHHL